jgi:Tfp pilus assembly protein PilN
MTALPIPSLNLMPAARVLAGRRRRRVRVWVGVVAVYGALTAGVLGYATWRGANAGSVADELSKAGERIGRLSAGVKAAEARLRAGQLELEAAREVSEHPDMSVLLRLIAQRAGREVTFDRLDIRPVAAAGKKSDIAAPNGYVLRLSGLAGAQAEVPRLARELQDLGIFESVSIVGIKAREAPRKPDGKGGEIQTPQLFSFEIEGVFSDNAAAKAGGRP